MQFYVEAKTRRWQDDCIVVPTHTQTRTFPIMCGPCGLGWAGLAGDDIHQETIRQSSNSFSCQSEISRSDVLMLGCPLSCVQLCPGNNIRILCFNMQIGVLHRNVAICLQIMSQPKTKFRLVLYFWNVKNIEHRSLNIFWSFTCLVFNVFNYRF